MKRIKCATKFCRRSVTRDNHSPVCPKCSSRKFKEKFPLKYSFNKLRQRAKERGHEFSLTYEQYEQFAKTTGYAELKGKHPYSLSINRKNPALGYHIDNIETVTLSMNTRLRYVNIPDYIRAEMEAATRPT